MKSEHASTVYLQVVGSGAIGAPCSVYVFTDQCRYLFNCGEGCQRLASEHKVKLNSLGHIFVTQKSWKRFGGLPGALLTLQESGMSEITIHGPLGLETILNDTQNFMRFFDLKVNHRPCVSDGLSFSDDFLIVRGIQLMPEIDPNRVNNSTKSSVGDPNSSNLTSADQDNAIKEVLAFICRPTPKPGALLPARCRELGVPPGPLMGELKRGQDVVLPNGSIVRASEVTKPPEYAPTFLIVDIPSVDYVRPLCEHLNADQLASSEDSPVSVIIHFTPSLLARTEEYQSWASRFDSATHIYVNDSNLCLGSESVHRIQYKLNHIYPRSFPLLSDVPRLTSDLCGDKSDGLKVIEQRVKRLKSDSDHHLRSLGSLKRDTSPSGLKDLDSPNENWSVADVPDSSQSRTEVKVLISSESASVDKNFEMSESSKLDDWGTVGRNQCWPGCDSGIEAFTGLVYHIRPNLGIDLSKRIEIDPESYIEECYSVDDFSSCLAEARDKEAKLMRSLIKTSDPNNEAGNNNLKATNESYDLSGDFSSIVHSDLTNEPEPSQSLKTCFSHESYCRISKKLENNEILLEDSTKKPGRSNISNVCIDEPINRDPSHSFPRVTFLGTGSCIPNKTRNTSGIFLELSNDCAAFLDCGEGTFGQLERLLGRSRSDDALRRVRLVYVSHLHADHHIGLVSILLARRALFAHSETVPKLVLLAPRGIQNYLKSYHDHFEPILDLFELIPNNNFLSAEGFLAISDNFPERVLSQISEIRTCYVQHCFDAFGISICLKNGRKITYSGDTMPCQSLINIGLDSDLLIHEATMEDDLKDDAVQKRHSTVSEALRIGDEMAAKYVVLTHFSQRYNKVPLIDRVPPNVAVAFDNMIIDFDDLPILPLYYPVFLSAFSEHVELMKKKRLKYKAKDKPEG